MASFLLKIRLAKLMKTPIEDREDDDFKKEKENIHQEMEEQRKTEW